MGWSYSASRSFRQCQRQWYFKNVAASARAKYPFRKRAYLLDEAAEYNPDAIEFENVHLQKEVAT